MKNQINKSDFVQAFDNYNRSDNFSIMGREALFDWLEDIDENMELDVIAICCEFTEYANIAEFNSDYKTDYENMDEIDETAVIDIDGDSFIIQAF